MPQGNRYRNTYDPVSMFDKGAKTIGEGSLFFYDGLDFQPVL